MSEIITERDEIIMAYNLPSGHLPPPAHTRLYLELYHKKDKELEFWWSQYQSGRINEDVWAEKILKLSRYDEAAARLIGMFNHDEDCTCREGHLPCIYCQALAEARRLLEEEV